MELERKSIKMAICRGSAPEIRDGNCIYVAEVWDSLKHSKVTHLGVDVDFGPHANKYDMRNEIFKLSYPGALTSE